MVGVGFGVIVIVPAAAAELTDELPAASE